MKNQSGFSLIEVLIAITIFTVFIAMYATSRGYLLADSARMQEEIKLRSLTEQELSKIILSPPKLTDSLTLLPETKTLEDHDQYEKIVEFKRLSIPDMNSLSQSSQSDEDTSNQQENTIIKKVGQKVKKNLEELVWQVRVTIRNKQTKFNFTLVSWIYNSQAKMDLGL